MQEGDLGHDGYEGGLADVAGLAPHVGPRDDQPTGPRGCQVGVIGHDRGVQGRVQHWVAPLHNVQLGCLVLLHELGPHIPVRRETQGEKHTGTWQHDAETLHIM